MHSYEPHRPRTAIALAAAALAAITFGLLVVAPAKFDSANPDARTLAAAKAAPTAVAISPARIDVVGIREPELASNQLERPVATSLAAR